MKAHQHFQEGQDLLMQARTATEPSRLIGLAQGHFLAAQTLIAAVQASESEGVDPAHRKAWLAAADQQYGPNGKPVKA
jgi:hypothetical protein